MNNSLEQSQVYYTTESNASVKDYFLLMKPRVMSLVVFTAFVGLVLAPGHVNPFIGFCGILFVSIGAGSAAAINMWYDRDIDAVMKRTQKRPIVTGKIEPDEALGFGVVTGVFSVLLTALCVNLVAAGLLLLTILYYIFIYTSWLKRSSIQNVVIGGVAGALPPMIGWSIVGGDISWESFSLFAIIFLWTPPHSWALTLYRVEDYRNCSVPMMPVIKGDLYTKWQIVIYTVPMFLSSYAPYYLDMTGKFYFYIATIGNAFFSYYTLKLFISDDKKNSLKLFVYSIFYLFALYLSLLLGIFV